MAGIGYPVGGELAAALAALAPPAPGWSRLLLVRHGETKSNKEKLLQGGGADTPLNELGVAQSDELAAALAASGAPIDRIATSHLSRAIATADPIAALFPAASRTVHAGLGEMLYGDIEGKPIAQMGPRMGEIAQSWRAGETSVSVDSGPGATERGESPDDLLARALAALGEVRRGVPEGGTLLVVAHSHLNKALLAALTGEGLARIHSMPQDNGCVNVIDSKNDEWQVRHVNLLVGGAEASKDQANADRAVRAMKGKGAAL